MLRGTMFGVNGFFPPSCTSSTASSGENPFPSEHFLLRLGRGFRHALEISNLLTILQYCILIEYRTTEMFKFRHVVPLAVLIVIAGCLLASQKAHAYAVSGNNSGYTLPQFGSSTFNGGWTDIWNNVSSPFQNFAQSLGSMGSVPSANFSFPTNITFSQSVPTGFHDAFEAFDAWLYGIVGFHISSVATFILNIANWILTFTKNIVDWLLALVR